MNLLNKQISLFKLLLVSLVSAIFIIYPNITFFSFEREFLGEAKQTVHLLFFIFRYFFFSLIICGLIIYNLNKPKISSLSKRILHTFVITTVSYFIYIGFSILLSPKPEWYSGMLLFQFLVMFILCTLVGHVYYLNAEQRRRELEIEQLKIENLQSRYDALTNQINPHLFFNSLNGLSSLVRKKDEEKTIEYVNKLSDVFRYILQSDKKVLVTLAEELEFAQAYLYMLEIRFANKLVFIVDIDKTRVDLKIPVLSLLPLIDNVVVHNTIDSEHKMEVTIRLNENNELVVSNPIFPKLSPHDTFGTGIKNLNHRFSLLFDEEIRIENDGKIFSVYLPLKKDPDENINS